MERTPSPEVGMTATHNKRAGRGMDRTPSLEGGMTAAQHKRAEGVDITQSQEEGE